MKPVAVITGGAGAIGRLLAAAFAEDGYQVHLVDASESVVDVAAQVGGVAHVLDATDADAVQTLAGIASVDVLINGIGVWPLVRVDDLDPASWRRFIDINLNSAYAVTWSCIAGLRAASGAVVNISSAIALKGHAEMVHYAAAKAGMIGMTKSLARALGPDLVRVNAVAPGLISTKRAVEAWGEDGQAAFRATRALPIDITTEDVVHAVRFLASPAARAITGQTLVVDGGTVMP